MRIFIGYLPIMFSDVAIGNRYYVVMKQSFSVPLPVPPDWYWSLSYVVLEFLVYGTGKALKLACSSYLSEYFVGAATTFSSISFITFYPSSG